ncbi:hypothetical protein ACFPIF_11950 [Brevundimonas faecalis]|uniref:hypothetical protein n=1 Tax=Brevundimonas faecalis TaxID=947378 RepID=UPI0036088436
MKFWKIVSILGGETNSAEEISKTKEEWEHFGQWFQNFSQIVHLQDRKKLDTELPKDFSEEVLKSSNILLFTSNDGTIRSRKIFDTDIEINIFDAFNKYGGDAIEEALEKGSFRL